MDQSCTFCGSIGTLVASDQGFTCTVCAGVVAVTVESLPAIPQQGTSKSSSKKTPFIHVNKDRVVLVYVSTLQSCLLAHVEALIRLGVNPALESVCRRIWLRTVEVSRVLTPGSMHLALLEFSPLLNNLNVNRTNKEIEIELEAVDRLYDHYASYTSTLWRFLRLEVVIWILYMALVWLQEAVTPLDLTLWLEQGTLPFLKMNEFQEEVQASYGVNLPKFVFQPKSVPRALEIEVGAGQLAKDIGLILPPVNLPLIIFRLCKILDLSLFIAKTAVKLFGLYWKDSGWDKETPKQLYYPQTISGACVVVALKLDYGLDDTHGGPLDGSSVKDWMQWAREVWKSKIQPVRVTLSGREELLKLSSKDLNEFVQFVDKSVMAGCEFQKSYLDLDKKISKLVKNWNSPDVRDNIDLPSKTIDHNPQPVRFRVGLNAVYVPSLYLYPCRMYWFIPLSGNVTLGTDYYYPFEFAAVLSTVSAILNVKPKHLEAAIGTLEKDMLLNEIKTMTEVAQIKLPKSYSFSISTEHEMVNYALRSMGLDKKKIKKLLKQDSRQINRIRAMVDEGMEVEGTEKTEEELIDKAVRIYQERFCRTQDHFGQEFDVPVVEGLTRLDKDRTLYSCRDSAEAMLYHAELSSVLNEPMVSMGPRLISTRRAFYYTQTHNADDIQQENMNYMSDTDVSTEDEERS